MTNQLKIENHRIKNRLFVNQKSKKVMWVFKKPTN